MLSMGLSGANAVAGAARSRATAASKRQAALATSAVIRSASGVWIAALTPVAPKKRLKRTKRRAK